MTPEEERREKRREKHREELVVFEVGSFVLIFLIAAGLVLGVILWGQHAGW